jgi:hypothetical protein
VSGPHDHDEPLAAPVRIRGHLWLRVLMPILTVAAGVLGATTLVSHSDQSTGALALTVLCGLVTLVAWWGEVAIDRERLAVRVLQRDGSQILSMDRVRLVGLNPGSAWRGGATLVVQDAAGRTVAVGGGYFPLRRVWAALRPYVVTNPEVVVHPSVNALAGQRRPKAKQRSGS